MGTTTAIAWTDKTFNPWWGCQRVSPGCEHCYAETFAKRTGNDVWGKEAERRFFGDKHWNEPVRWNRQAEVHDRRFRVFCASMADVFEDRRDLDAERERLWGLIAETPSLDWQLLTKRPQNVARMVPWGYDAWPVNVWLGTTVEDQKRAEERVPILAGIAAEVRFLSCEPLLGPVDLFAAGALVYRHGNEGYRDLDGYWVEGWEGGWENAVEWVIVGGESGAKHRPLNLDHARSLRDQCETAGVPLFFKQDSGARPGAQGRVPDDLWNAKSFPTGAR